MEQKKYVILTSPKNAVLMEDTPDGFFDTLREFFKKRFTVKNTIMVTSVSFAETKVHVFEDSDYIGWIYLIPEGEYHEPDVSTKH